MAMPFNFPGRKLTRPKMWFPFRSKRSQAQRKARAGEWRQIELRFTHKTVVKLLQPKAEAASGVIWDVTRAAWA